MAHIILSVVYGGRYQLRMSTEFFPVTEECNRIIVELDNLEIEITRAFVAFVGNGRLSHHAINEWIINNHLQNTGRGRPTKLVFTYTINNGVHKFVLYPNQGNLLRQNL